MKSSNRSLLSRRAALVFGITATALFTPAALAQTTGFNKTTAGPFDYSDTANWVGGATNGVWDASLVTTAAQTVTFGADTTLLTGLNIGYTGNVDLTFRSDGVANRTLTLGGDIIIAPVSNRTITFGSTVANQGLNANLGGNRIITVGTGKTISFLNSITGGDLTLTGNSNTATGGTVKFTGDQGNAATSNVVATNNLTLQFDSSTLGVVGATRAQSVTLSAGGKLLVSGGNSGANTIDTVTGALVIDGSATRPRSSSNAVSSITVSSGAKNALLNIGSLQRTANGVALFRGTGLGNNSIASATGGSSNIQIGGTAPALIGGGGAAGSTNISIISWAIGGISTADNGSTFVTYTAANGIRALTAAEFATDFTGAATNNVALTGATTVNSTVTANSLLLNGAPLTGTGKINVTSGAVFAAGNSVSPISVGLDFGTAEGVMGYTRGTTIAGTIAGSGGLTVYGTRTDEALVFTNAASTYTGNTVVLSNMSVVGGVLPNGGRGGDVYVYGNLQLSASGYTGTINGLFGNGTVAYGNSGVSSLTIGDNNASSLFTGVIAGNSNLNITKIGSGTASFTGEHTYARVMSILGGTWEVTKLADGGVASGIGQSSSIAANLVINGGALKYTGAATSTDRLFTIGTSGGGLEASGSGAVNFTAVGANVSAEAANRGGTRTVGSNVITGVSNVVDLVVGARVIGAGITAGTTITAINTATGEITLSANATTASSANMSFSTDRTLSLTGSNTGNNTISGILSNSAGAGILGVTKSGVGTWVLSGANTYTGATTISQGTLALGAADRIADTSNLVMSGGTFATRGFSETLGTLTLSANSVIDLGSGASSLVFADSSSTTWNESITLSFINFTEGVDSIRIGSTDAGLTELQLAQLIINGTNHAAIDSSGYLTLGAAIPEPSSIALLGGFGALAFAGLRRRRSRVSSGV